MTKKRGIVEKILETAYGVKENVGRALSIAYQARKFLNRPAPFFMATLGLNIAYVIAVLISLWGLYSVSPSSALQVLATIVEASATILAIFFGLMGLAIQQQSSTPSTLKAMYKRGEFFAACLNFSLAIISGLIAMVSIEPNGRVEGVLIIIPSSFLIFSLFSLFLLFFRTVREQQKEE